MSIQNRCGGQVSITIQPSSTPGGMQGGISKREDMDMLPSATPTADSKKLEHGGSMIKRRAPSVFELGLEDGHVQTLWLLL